MAKADVDNKDMENDDEDVVKEAEDVDTKDGDEEDENVDKDEIDTDKIKKEAYQERDQPKTKTTDEIDDVAPAGDDEAGVKPAKKPNTAKLAKESVAQMFEGAEGLSEDFMSKATTIFEAAFNSKLKEAVEGAKVEVQESFDTRYVKLEKELSEKVDTYLDFVVKDWITENEVAITKSIHSEIAENFLTDFKALFEKHNISIPEDKIDLLEQSEANLAEAKKEVDTLTESILEKNEIIFMAEQADAIAELSKGLAETQVEKLKSLVEDIESKDIETFTTKAKIIAESFLGKSKDKKPAEKAEERTEDKSPSIMDSYVTSARVYNNR